MRERPIIMTAESVRAILAGQKSQTRRVVTPQPSAGVRWGTLGKGWEDGHGRPLRNPYGAPGDRLWVREGWRAEARELERGRLSHLIDYRADTGTPTLTATDSPDAPRFVQAGNPWRSPLFMPRWASRLTLEVTAVRVERVQDISEEDARAEGATPKMQTADDVDGAPDASPWRAYRAGFADLWDKINGPRGYGWGVNPWVWVLTFQRAEG